MAKKKNRPTSTTAYAKAANRQPGTVRQTAASSDAPSSSSVEPQQEELTTQKESESQKPSGAVEKKRTSANGAAKQVKAPSSRTSGTSAAERRRERVASQRTSSTSRTAPSAGERRRRAVRKTWWESYSLPLIGGILLVVVIAVGIFIIMSNSQGTGKTGPTDPGILKQVTTVKQSVLANVNTGGVHNILKHPSGNPPVLTGPHGKPEVFFYGAEFCPYCAAERWSVTIAMSRFGIFTQLPLLVSSEDSISTFTFHGSKYTSTYIDFVPVEAEDQSRNPLENPSAAQQQVLTQNNVTGFPFIDIANDYIATDAIIADPTQLEGLSQQDIANKLSDPTNPLTQQIVGGANYFTAAICLATNNQPASVCNSDPIPSISNFLTTNTVASVSPTAPLSVAVANCPPESATCRKRNS